MKIRNGFVSNSSSSSFLIIGSESIRNANSVYADSVFILDGDNRQMFMRTISQAFEFKNHDKIKLIMDADQIGLTRFLGDHSSIEEHFGLEDNSYYAPSNQPPVPHIESIEYVWGNHGGPYSEDGYVKVSDGIYILKELT